MAAHSVGFLLVVMIFSSNFQFVSKISEMKDFFSNGKNDWQSVNSEALHHLFFPGRSIF
jgi:predicted small integral membrane protein